MFPDVITLAARNTIIYTTLSFIFGLGIALALALMKLSSIRPYRVFAVGYIELLRGLPALITLIFIGFGIPIAFEGFRTPGGRVGLVCSAVHRLRRLHGGDDPSRNRGRAQRDRSRRRARWGCRRPEPCSRSCFPRHFGDIIPPLTNELVLLIKDTSLFFVLGTTPMTEELTKFARDFMIDIRNATPLTVAAVVYLIITLPLTYFVSRLEKRSAVSR